EVVVIKLDAAGARRFHQKSDVAEDSFRRKTAPPLVVDLHHRTEVAAKRTSQTGMIRDAFRRQAVDQKRGEWNEVKGERRKIFKPAKGVRRRIARRNSVHLAPDAWSRVHALMRGEAMNEIQERPLSLSGDHEVRQIARYGNLWKKRWMISAPHERE